MAQIIVPTASPIRVQHTSPARKTANKGANSTQGYMLSGQGSTSERCMTDQPEKVKASPPSDS